MIGRARLKYLGVSAQKTRLVVDQVRGKSVGDAQTILRLSPKRVAKDLLKVVASALANVQQREPSLDVDRLVVARAVVDEAPPLKRARHTTMGRVFSVRKRSCHVTIDLDLRARKTATPPSRKAEQPAADAPGRKAESKAAPPATRKARAKTARRRG